MTDGCRRCRGDEHKYRLEIRTISMNCVISNELHLITDKIFTVRNGWGKADANFVSSWLFGHFDIDVCIYSTRVAYKLQNSLRLGLNKILQNRRGEVRSFKRDNCSTTAFYCRGTGKDMVFLSPSVYVQSYTAFKRTDGW